MKLEFRNVTYKSKSLPDTRIIQELNFDLERGKHLSLFCVHEDTANTLLGLMLGNMRPSSGNIIRQGSVSSPIGQYGWFHSKMSCRENIHFVCELYGKNSIEICNKISCYIQNSTNLSKKFGTLKQSEKRKISLTLALLLDLDIYIIKNGTGHPDKSFQKRFDDDFKKMLDNSATAVTISKDIKFLKKYFKHSFVIDTNSPPKYYPNINEAIENYKIVNQQKRS